MSIVRTECPVCGGQITTLYRRRNRVMLADSFTPSSSDFGIFYDLYRCDACHAVYAGACPGPEELAKLYHDACHAGYMAEEQNRRQNFQRLLEATKSFLMSSTNVKMLDVGCATGLFMDCARERFPEWDVRGVEASASAVDTCRAAYGLSVTCGMFDMMDMPAHTYDLVTMLDVIEHVHKPMAMIHKANACLKPGGLLVITTPNIGSWTALLFGRRWWGFRLMHTLYFSRLSMRQMLARGGFRVVCMRGLVRFFSLGYCMRHLGWSFGGRPGGLVLPLALGDMMVVARKENESVHGSVPGGTQ